MPDRETIKAHKVYVYERHGSVVIEMVSDTYPVTRFALDLSRDEARELAEALTTSATAAGAAVSAEDAADGGPWEWTWLDDSPHGETYAVRDAKGIVAYTNRFQKGYELAKSMAAEHNARMASTGTPSPAETGGVRPVEDGGS